MPGIYKEKSCKYCGNLYRKKGIYCSHSCSSYDKTPTDAQRNAMRKVAIEYNRTPEAIAKQKQINTPLASLTVDEFAVNVPSLDPDLSDYNDYNKAEDW